MTVKEVMEELDLYKQDLSLYKTYYLKARGDNQLELEKKYQSVKKMVDRMQEKLDNLETGITKGDFEC